MPPSSQFDWPPPYAFRVSRRCKHLQMRISPSKGLEVVSPRQLSERKIIEFINSKKTWVIKHWVPPQPVCVELPQQIKLKALEQCWSVSYEASSIKRVMLATTTGQRLSLVGNIEDHARCIKALKDWLKLMAERYLIPRLDHWSEQLQLPFSECSLRIQKTRWGSCSYNHKISLNASLLFLPAMLVDHVLIHELCHTVYLDHSAEFWALMEYHDKHCQKHRHALKQAIHEVPSWCH